MTTNSTDGTDRYARGADGTLHVATRLVVATGDVPNVLALLPKGAGLVADEIAGLDLTLVEIDDVDAVVSEVADAGHPGTGRGEGDPLERLMAWMRSEARRRFGGVPEMGKDRVVLGDEGLPIPSPKTPTIIATGADGPFATPEGQSAPVEERDGSGVRVGLLDTSVIDDPTFGGTVKFLGGSQAWPREVRQAWQGHGTFVAGLVRTQAPHAEILVRAILTGGGFATAWDAAKGMAELRESGVHVINMSLGCVTGDNQPPFALRTAVERLRDDVLLVAAAGNYDPRDPGPIVPTWPAALAGVFAVGSMTEKGSPSAFSPAARWVDLMAAGEEVRSTFVDGDVLCPLERGGRRPRTFRGAAIWSGTSFAAATVTGRLVELAARQGGDLHLAVRDLADKLRTGELADDIVRQP